MAQLHGHLIEHEGKLGLVRDVTEARLVQPDRVARDVISGEEVGRESRPDLDVAQVHVLYEGGDTATLTEHLDQWTVLGSVVVFPPGSSGELAEQQAVTNEIADRFDEYAVELRAAAPLAAREAVVAVEFVDDGPLTLAEE